MQTGQPVGEPGDGVALARTGRMLDQIVMARTRALGMGGQLAHGIQLMKSGKNQLFLLACTPLELKFLGLQMDETPDNLQPAILGQDLAP